MLNRKVLAPVFCLVLLAAVQARATVLAPGSTVTPDAQANPLTDPTFTVLATASGTFNASGIDTGTYHEWVVRESSGQLDFVYQFTNDSSSQTALERMSAFDYKGFTANVGYVAGSGDQAPVSADATGSGSVLAFNFPASNAVSTGASSDLLIVRTNAVAFDNSGTFTVQDGAATTVTGLYQPTAVPEPSALALTGIGGLVLLGCSRRRRAAAV